MNENARIAGVVLGGGASSRLGRDKTTLVLDPQGTPLLTRTARILRRVVPEVIVSGKEHDEFASLPDDAPGKGPVGAITTALRHTGKACFILACDMAFMDEDTLRLLLEAWRRRPPNTLVTAFVHPETSKKENLVAIYEQGALRFLEPSLQADLLKIALVVPEKHYCMVPIPPHARELFFNINHPADLAEARKRLGAMTAGGAPPLRTSPPGP